MNRFRPPIGLGLMASAALLLAACGSRMEAPASTSIAVSRVAVDDAAGAGGAEFAPLEMSTARAKLAQANQAMADKDYQRANALATQAQADARLAQGKANSTKAKAAADALQDDVRVLRAELDRASALKPAVPQ